MKLTFGVVIRERREELHLSQGAVARGLGISSPEFVGMVEKGQRRLQLNKVPMLAVVLQLDPVALSRLALFEAHRVIYETICGSEPPERPTKVQMT